MAGLIVYPDDTHYFRYQHRCTKAFNAIDAFFDRTLLRKEGTQSTSGG